MTSSERGGGDGVRPWRPNIHPQHDLDEIDAHYEREARARERAREEARADGVRAGQVSGFMVGLVTGIFLVRLLMAL